MEGKGWIYDMMSLAKWKEEECWTTIRYRGLSVWEKRWYQWTRYNCFGAFQTCFWEPKRLFWILCMAYFVGWKGCMVYGMAWYHSRTLLYVMKHTLIQDSPCLLRIPKPLAWCTLGLEHSKHNPIHGTPSENIHTLWDCWKRLKYVLFCPRKQRYITWEEYQREEVENMVVEWLRKSK
jgi:hypothetical protein